MTSDTKKDPAWNYAQQVDPTNRDKLRCNFCLKVTTGGVFRVKQHLIGGQGNVKRCTKVPGDVKEEIKEYMNNKKQVKEAINVKRERFVHESLVSEDDEDDGDIMELKHKRSQCGSNTTSSGSSDWDFPGFPKKTKQPRTKGPLDLFLTSDSEQVVQGRKAKRRQMRIDGNDAARKELRNKACTAIAKWIYDAGLPFNCVNYDSFGVMIEAIGQYGRGMKPPSYYEVRVPLLKKEVEHTKKTMKDHKAEWEKNGCSLMCDGWKDRKERTLINFLVNSPKGSFYLESVDASNYTKTGLKIYELICDYVEKVGPSNVVQVVTDSASNNKLAGKFLEAKYPHMFWTPCAAHCVDLILEDIFKIRSIKRTFSKAVFLNSYIFTRPGVMNMLRHFTQERELLRPSKTRFATAFVTLSRIHKQENNLRKMFTSEKWTGSKYAKESAGKKVSEIVLMPSFWNSVVYALKVAGPLVSVLRLVDGVKKPPMGYIYEAMDKAKEAIGKSFNNNESKYRKIFEIIDIRWEVQLHQPLHATGYYLNPEIFYTNTEIEQDEKVMKGLYTCISKMVPDIKVQDKISGQLATYRAADGLFGIPMAKRQRTTRPPVEWWTFFGSSTPDLQKFAIKVLSLTCSASGCERNWSVFEQLHTKKRNRLAQAHLNDLVFVKYNRALKRRYALRESIDPISLNDIDESDEWLIGRLDGESDENNEFAFIEEDNLTWNDVARASGVGEVRYNSRTQSTSRVGVTRKSASKSKAPIHLSDEDDDEDEEEQEFEGEDPTINYDADFDVCNLQDELDDIEDNM